MIRTAGAGITCLLIAALGAEAQTIRIGIYGADVVDKQVTENRTADGIGIGARLEWHPGRVSLGIDVTTASLDGDGVESYDSREIDIRAGYALNAWLSAYTGVFRRSASPDLFAQDVGAVRLGLLTRNRLTQNATIRILGAYLIAPRFSGGGDANFAVEFGVGFNLHSTNGRWTFGADYALERIDRVVTGEDVPIQYSAFSLGITYGL